jgi:hypothetical protein
MAGSYSAQDFEDPLFSLLVKLGVSTVTAADYDVLASVDADTLEAYVEAALGGDAAMSSWEGFLLALQDLESRAGGDNEETCPPPPPDGVEAALHGVDGGEKEGDDEGLAPSEQEDDEEGEKPIDSSAAEAPWKCTRCLFPRNPNEAEACVVCHSSYWHEDEPLPASAVLREGAAVLDILIRAEDLPVPGSALMSFRVKKLGSSLFSSKVKERIIKVDFCGQRFLNCDPANPGKHSIALDSKHLYRVEKRSFACGPNDKDSMTRHVVRVYFFKTAHPIDLEFSTGTECRRFMEAASLQRRSPVVWAPSLCRGHKRETVLRVFSEKAVKRSNLDLSSPEDLPTLTASRISHEIVRFWTGSIDLADEVCGGDIAVSRELRTALTSHSADVFLISLLNLKLRGDSSAKAIPALFESLLGPEFYTVLNSLSSLNAFANVEAAEAPSKNEGDPVVLVFVRKPLLCKLRSIAILRLGDSNCARNRGVLASFGIQESTVALLAATTDVDEDTMDTSEKHCRLRALMASARGIHADANVDISVNFDYFFICGCLGYSSSCIRGQWSDELHEALAGARTFLHGFSEETGILGSGSAGRVLLRRREAGTTSKTVCYATIPMLAGQGCSLMGNSAVLVSDIFCLRTYLSAWSVPVPQPILVIHHMRLVLDGIVFGAKLSSSGGVTAGAVISSASVTLSGACFDVAPLVLPSKVYQDQKVAPAAIHVDSPPLVPVVPAVEWLAMQSFAVSLRGIVPQTTFRETDVVGSAAVMLRSVCGASVGVPVVCVVPLLRHTVPIGVLECTLLLSFL